jgi:hypothetical protein
VSGNMKGESTCVHKRHLETAAPSCYGAMRCLAAKHANRDERRNRERVEVYLECRLLYPGIPVIVRQPFKCHSARTRVQVKILCLLRSIETFCPPLTHWPVGEVAETPFGIGTLDTGSIVCSCASL